MFCPQHNALICNKCAIISHHDHVAELKEVKRDDIVQFCTKANNIIDEESQKLAIIRDGFSSYIANDVQLTSLQFMEMVQSFKRVLTVRA